MEGRLFTRHGQLLAEFGFVGPPLRPVPETALWDGRVFVRHGLPGTADYYEATTCTVIVHELARSSSSTAGE